MSVRAPVQTILRVFFGVADLCAALVVLFGTFVALPARWAPVDVGAIVLGVLFFAAGLGLLGDTRWAPRVARVAALSVFALGLALVVALATALGWLAGIYGPVGRGGVVLFTLVLALIVPWLLVLPAAQVVWLRAREPDGR